MDLVCTNYQWPWVFGESAIQFDCRYLFDVCDECEVVGGFTYIISPFRVFSSRCEDTFDHGMYDIFYPTEPPVTFCEEQA